MPLWSRLCGNSLSRRHVEEYKSDAAVTPPTAFVALQGDSVRSPADEIASGKVALDGYGLQVPKTESSDTQTDVETVPWYSIRSFLDFVKLRRGKLRLRFAQKDQPSSQEGRADPWEVNHDVYSAPQPPPEFLETGDEAGSSEVSTHEDLEGTNEDCPNPISGHVSISAMDFQENASLAADVEIGKTGLKAMFLAEEHKDPKIEPDSRSNLADHTSIIDRFAAGSGARNESQARTVTESTPATTKQSADAGSETESTESIGCRRIAPGKEASDDFCVSAGMIKNSTGAMKAEKLFYDTGSPDSWVAQLLVTKHNIPTRPIRPEDLLQYDTIGGGRVIPTDYAEIWVTDDHHGINEFTKVCFNITDSLGGRGLLLGREFMKKHGVMLDAKQGPGVYVTTARNASEAAKEEQRLLLAQRERERLRAQAIVASTAGSTTTGTGVSTGEKQVLSSRTSTSSGSSKYQPPPKYS